MKTITQKVYKKHGFTFKVQSTYENGHLVERLVIARRLGFRQIKLPTAQELLDEVCPQLTVQQWHEEEGRVGLV